MTTNEHYIPHPTEFLGFTFNGFMLPDSDTGCFYPLGDSFPLLEQGAFDVVGILCEHGHQWHEPLGLMGSLGFEDELPITKTPWWVEYIIHAGGDLYIVTTKLAAPYDWDCPHGEPECLDVWYMLMWLED